MTIEDFYHSSESFDHVIKDARIMRVSKGAGIVLSDIAPYFTSDDWFHSYGQPSIRVQIKNALKFQNNFDFDNFDKYIRKNRKELHRIYFFREKGYVSVQTVTNEQVENVTIPIDPVSIEAFLNL
jgi:hypothetical protein